KVNATIKLLSQQGGKQLTFDLKSQIENLTAGAGSNQLTQATVSLQANGKATDLKQFALTGYKVEVAQQNQPMLTLSGSGSYDKAVESADFQVALQANLARLLQARPQPEATVSSGTAELKG